MTADERRINEIIAERVMGWKRMSIPEAAELRGEDEDVVKEFKQEFGEELSASWFDADGKEVQEYSAEDPMYPREEAPRWNPLLDANAQRDLRAKTYSEG